MRNLGDRHYGRDSIRFVFGLLDNPSLLMCWWGIGGILGHHITWVCGASVLRENNQYPVCDLITIDIPLPSADISAMFSYLGGPTLWQGFHQIHLRPVGQSESVASYVLVGHWRYPGPGAPHYLSLWCGRAAREQLTPCM